MQPDFNSWTICFGFAGLVGLVSAFLLFFHFKKSSYIYLAFILLFFSITLIDWVLIWTRYQLYFPWFLLLGLLFKWLYGPLFWMYIKSKAPENSLNAYQKQVHLIPFYVLILLYSPILIAGLATRQDLIRTGFTTFPFYQFITKFIYYTSLIHLTIYFALAIREARKFASLQITFRWSQLLIFSFGLFISNFWLYDILSQARFFDRSWDYGIAIAMVVFIISVMVVSYVSEAIFDGLTITQSILSPPLNNITSIGNSNQKSTSIQFLNNVSETTDPENKKVIEKYKNSGLPPQHVHALALKLNEKMVAEKWYQDYTIRLESVAEKMNLSRHHTSQIINEHFKMNFFEYINSLRIEEAKIILTDPGQSQTSIKEIGFQVGFNNKVSFFKSFKSSTGMTPSEFRDHVHTNQSVSQHIIDQ